MREVKDAALLCSSHSVRVVEQSHHESITSGALAMQKKRVAFCYRLSFLYTGAGCLQHVNTSRDRRMEIEDPEAKHYHINTEPLSASNTKHY